MSQEPPTEEVLSTDELTELLAEAEETTPGAIEQGAAEIKIAAPAEADVIDE